MATINIAGVLKTPNDTPLQNGSILIYANDNANGVVKGSLTTVPVDGSGIYSVDLVQNYYRVFYQYNSGKKIFLGDITVDTGDVGKSLNDLLINTSTIILTDLEQFIISYVQTNVLDKIGVDIAAQGDYVSLDFMSSNPPSLPTGLTLSTTTKPNSIGYNYGIQASWNEGVSNNGSNISYKLVVYETANPSNKITFFTDEVIFTVWSLQSGTNYTVVLSVYDAFGNSSSPVSDTHTVSTDSTAPNNVTGFTATAGLKEVLLNWQNPVDADFKKVYVYSSSSTPVLVTDTLEYSGTSSSVRVDIDLAESLYFGIQTEDYAGNKSSIYTTATPVVGVGFTEANVDDYINSSILNTQHIADDAITADKILSNAVVTNKLAVLDLNNLIENHTFELGDINWVKGNSNYVSIASGDATFINATTLDNDLIFSCEAATKYYLAATITVAGSGVNAKGLKLVCLDINNDIIASSIATFPVSFTGDDVSNYKISGFYTTPTGTVKAYLRIESECVSGSVIFHDAYCRLGSGVLIENGEITADKINVSDIFAQDIVATGSISGATLSTNSNVGVNTAGTIIDSVNGIRLYNSSNVVTSQFNLDGSGQIGNSGLTWTNAGYLTINGAYIGNLTVGSGALASDSVLTSKILTNAVSNVTSASKTTPYAASYGLTTTPDFVSDWVGGIYVDPLLGEIAIGIPYSTISKYLVVSTVEISTTATLVGLRLYRYISGVPTIIGQSIQPQSNIAGANKYSIAVIDNPNTTLAVTYQIRVWTSLGISNYVAQTNTLSVMEVKK